MSELSNAVTVLIARMESHPEDFESWGPNRPKFAGTAEALYGLVGLDEAKKNAFWYLNDADKQALTEAWKKFHLAKFEKDVMECIFDDGAEEREREMQIARMKAKQQAMQAAMTQGTSMHNTSYPYTVNAPINPGQISNAANSTMIAANSFTIGKETIDEDLITKLKKWVGEK